MCQASSPMSPPWSLVFPSSPRVRLGADKSRDASSPLCISRVRSNKILLLNLKLTRDGGTEPALESRLVSLERAFSESTAYAQRKLEDPRPGVRGEHGAVSLTSASRAGYQLPLAAEAGRSALARRRPAPAQTRPRAGLWGGRATPCADWWRSGPALG